MKKVFIALLLLIVIPEILSAGFKRAPEDFMGRVPIPNGNEVEVLKFKTNQIVYAGTNGSGIYVSYDAGTNWVNLSGFPKEFGFVRDMIITPSNDIYVATFGGGIYFSSDNGASFKPKNKGITNLFTQAIAMTKDGILVCGTYGSGIFYSVDKGSNWVRTDVNLRYDNVRCINIMNNGYIVAGTYGGGFYVSRDTCKTWLIANTLLTNYFINNLTKDINGKIYAATNGGGIMFSPDGIQWLTYGNKWHENYEQYPKPLLDSSATAVGVNAYELLMGTRWAGMYFWDKVWDAWASTGVLSAGITACAVSSNGTILASRAFGDIIRSTDNGMLWTICSNQIADIDTSADNYRPDFLNIFISKFDNSLVSVMKKSGNSYFYLSLDHGNTWKYLNSIATGDIFDVEMTPDSSIFVADEIGIHKYSKTSKNFTLICNNPSEEDKFYRFRAIEYNPTDTTLFAVYLLVENADPGPPAPDPPYKRLEYRLYKSVDKGLNWTYKSYGENVLDLLYSESNGDIYLKIGKYFSKSTDNGETFRTLQIDTNKMIYGKDDNLYYWDKNNGIYVQKKKLGQWINIPFTPEILDSSSDWSILTLGANKDGDVYVAVNMNVPNQGLKYELYMTSDDGDHWQTMKSCFNMDKIRLIKSDNNGYTFFLTNSLYKVLDPSNLQPPTIIYPPNGYLGAEINPIFKWNRAKLAEEYELQIDQDKEFNYPFETNVTGDTICKTILNLTVNQKYYWRIRSKTHSARSDWFIGSFTIGMEPPILISPLNGSTKLPLNANLTWHKLTDCDHYLIQVSEDENFENIVYSKDNFPDTTLTTDKLLGLKLYYWRVKGFSDNNPSQWSEVWNFRTTIAPPKLIYPDNNSIDRLLSEQFRWLKADEALKYYIQVSKDTAFSNIFYESNVGADTFNLIYGMLPETEYFWHVASVNADGNSEYSGTWKFRTSLKAVELITPENKKVNVPIDVKFTWKEHNGGNQYQIQMSNTADFVTTLVDQTLNNVFEFKTDKLEYYKNYYWRVRLVMDARVGLWSEAYSFKTGIESAVLLNPPDKSIDQPNTLNFKWNPVFGAEFYQLEISKNNMFTDMVYSMDSIPVHNQYIPDLEPEILYYWRVRAWNQESYGTTQWSAVWTFTTGKVTLILRNPKAGTKGANIPTILFWYPATTAEYYHLEVASDANFANIVFEKDSIYDTKWTLTKTDVATQTDYYWHVKGVSKQYTTPWSETWNFQTGSVSVKESKLFSSLKLYPNPTGNGAELSINYSEACTAKILITTEDGKVIRSDEIGLLQGETLYNINSKNLNSGTYYITIITPSGYITKELVVVK